MVGGFLGKLAKNNLLAVQIEKTEINILQKEGVKKQFYFSRQTSKKFLWNLINPFNWRVDTSN